MAEGVEPGQTCRACNGKGRRGYEVYVPDRMDYQYPVRECDDCAGTGRRRPPVAPAPQERADS